MTEQNVVQLLEHMGRCYRRSYVPMDNTRVEAIRALLVQELHAAEAPVRTNMPVFSLPSFQSFFHLGVLRPVLAVVVLGVFGIGSLMRVASASLPGDTLYTIKLVREQAVIRLTRDEKERANLSVRLAIVRADEVKRVVAREESREQKVAHLSEAVAGLEQQVAKASEALVALPEKKEFASTFSEGASQIVSMLTEANEEATKSNGVVAAEVARTLTNVTETKALLAFASNPPVALASSVSIEEHEAPLPVQLIQQEKKESPLPLRQKASLANSAQSVFSLPIAESVLSGEEHLPIAVSIQSAP